jgi:hypothetical protein
MRKQFVAAITVGIMGVSVAPLLLAQNLEMPDPPAPAEEAVAVPAQEAAMAPDQNPGTSSVTLPERGSSMSQVADRFGAPGERVAAVGQPPISRWVYPSFIVYFEHDHVVHAVVTGR